MIKAVFSDLDGVIRHWQNDALYALEAKYNLPLGTVFKAAFHPDLLRGAIQGEYSHGVWVKKVETKLKQNMPPPQAEALVSGWLKSPFEIDHTVLITYRKLFPQAQLILVTNATDQLNQDLTGIGITDCFDMVINSSEIGIAKPHPQFYKLAIKQAAVIPSESLWVDDTLENIKTAQNLGFHSHLYKTKDEAIAYFKGLT